MHFTKASFIPLFTLLIVSLTLATVMPKTAQAGNQLNKQQQAYIDAYDAIKRNDRHAIAKYKKQLQDYALYPYVLYHDYRVNMSHTPSRVIESFLHDYRDLYLSDKLRRHWLKYLAKKKHWKTFYANYRPQSSVEMQCQFLNTRFKYDKPEQKKKAIKEAQQLWESRIKLPDSCKTVENYLRNHRKYTATMVWNRIGYLIKKRYFKSAQELSKDLSRKDQKTVKEWIYIVKNPKTVTKPITSVSGYVRKSAFMQATRNLASEDSEAAKQALDKYYKRYGLSKSQYLDLERKIALRSAYRYGDNAKALLLDVNKNGNRTEETLRWQAQIAIRNSNWIELLDTIEIMPTSEQQELQWQYWKARALEARGDKKTAKNLYANLAKKRNYYGFLAADRINAPYQFNPKTVKKFDQNSLIKKYSALRRIQELVAIDWVRTARVEWHHFLPTAKPHELAAIAVLADKWQQYPHAIKSLALAKEWDQIELRFPTPHKTPVMQNAKKNDIDAAWIYGIIRKESAFNPTIRSSVGAVGLMQIMPRTARYIGKKIGVKNTSVYALTEAKNNIELGSAYMRYLSDKYDSNKVLATAAYNAGPHRVKQWTENLNRIDADQWVDAIPFSETRKYVKSVLEYTTVFNSILHGKHQRLRDNMPPIGSQNIDKNDKSRI